ncbi:hypothetical protein BS47DRAFT_1351652, partial [Hydnum rufescens UP504]
TTSGDLYLAMLGKYHTTRNQSIAMTKRTGRAPQNLLRRAIFQVFDAAQCRACVLHRPCFVFLYCCLGIKETRHEQWRVEKAGLRIHCGTFFDSAMNVQ